MSKYEIRKTSIIGMGALGLLYGSHIARQAGMDAVEFIVGESRFQSYCDRAFLCNGEEVKFKITLDSKAEPADLLIVAVKYTALAEALDTMKNCIGPNTIILSVLNGISSEQIIGGRYGMEKVIYTVAQGMDAMKFGNDFQFTNMGKLHMGITEDKQREKLKGITDYFDRIQIPYVIEEDIIYRMWSKFMLNVGVNQTCMVYDTNYGGVLIEGDANRTMLAAMREVIALANAEGIPLSEKDVNQYMDILGTLNPEGMPSMRQDRINRRLSEVEIFAGTVIAKAKMHNLYVPTNEFLYKRVKEIESSYLHKAGFTNQQY